MTDADDLLDTDDDDWTESDDNEDMGGADADAEAGEFELPVSVDGAFGIMSEFDPEDAERLQREWHGDAQANLSFARAFAEEHPELVRIVEASGLGDSPAIVEAAAMLGRKFAKVPGDPDSGMSDTDTSISEMARRLDMDPTSRERLEQRLDVLHDLQNTHPQKYTSVKIQREIAQLHSALDGDEDVSSKDRLRI